MRVLLVMGEETGLILKFSVKNSVATSTPRKTPIALLEG